VGDHGDFPRQTEGSEANYTTVGVDIAKSVMQLHWMDPETGEIINKPVKRVAFLEHFANRTPCLIGMEACWSLARRWSRSASAGHRMW